MKENGNLREGDIEVLTIAKMNGGIVIMDEDYGRKVAEVEEVKCRGTVYLLFLLLKNGVIEKGETIDILDAIIEEGWYCSTDLYAKILRRIEVSTVSSERINQTEHLL